MSDTMERAEANANNEPARSDAPAARTNSMQIMDSSGHMTVTWNPSSTEEVANARQIFTDYTAKGYQAFRVRNGTEQGDRMRDFDERATKVMLVPQLRGG